MAYTTLAGRQQLLGALADAVEELGFALVELGEAYEQLDEYAAERLEEGLFRSVQMAYGRAQRTHSAFAERSGIPRRTFSPPSPGAPSSGAKGFIDSAIQAAGRADSALGVLQDSMLPVEVGDVELRAGLAEVRELLGGLPSHARELLRTLGR
jgi:hypothetical protein